MGRIALLAVLVALTASPAQALTPDAAPQPKPVRWDAAFTEQEALHKATGLHVRDPLSTTAAMAVAARQGGYTVVFAIRRLTASRVRLRVCGQWLDLYINGVKVGQVCGRTVTVEVRSHGKAVEVLLHGRPLPTPN